MIRSSGLDTLLVVDDDKDFRGLIAMLAQIHSLRFLEAGDCCQAVEILQREKDRVKTVLLDYFMPGMAPPKCAASIKELIQPGCKLILVTAAVDAAERASELRIEHWLAKPFDIEQLEAMIEN